MTTPSSAPPVGTAVTVEQLQKQRQAYSALEAKWEKAKDLLVQVNQQNKTLRSDVAKKTEQLKKLYDEYSAQKTTISELETERDSHVERLREQQTNTKKLESMVEALGDASTGLAGEQELRLAELQRSNDRLVHEVAQRDDECRELQSQLSTARARALDAKAQLELQQAHVTKLTQEKAFINSQIGAERNRCSQLAQELDLMRNRLADAESRAQSQAAARDHSLQAWLQRAAGDKTYSMYVGVIGVVTLLLLWVYMSTRE